MTTEIAAPSGDAQLIDRRLDAIDRTLLGLLPRSERLEMVAKIEARIRELAGADTAVSAILTEPLEPAAAAPVGRTRRRRSRLAVAAGVLGIVALALLIMSPVIYIGAAMLGEIASEWLLVGVLSIYVLAVTVAGALAVVFGVVAIFRLTGSSLMGRGWAITGVCAGPFPMLVGCLLVLLVGGQLLGSEVFAVTVSQSGVPSAPVSNTTCAACQAYATVPPANPPAVAAAPSSGSPMPWPAAPPGDANAPPPLAMPEPQPLQLPAAVDTQLAPGVGSQLPLAESKSNLPASDAPQAPSGPAATVDDPDALPALPPTSEAAGLPSLPAAAPM